MAHLGARAFEEIAGEVVQTTSFVLCNRFQSKYKAKYRRLVVQNSQLDKEKAFINRENEFVAPQSYFKVVPGQPIAYWLSQKAINNFEK